MTQNQNSKQKNLATDVPMAPTTAGQSCKTMQYTLSQV